MSCTDRFALSRNAEQSLILSFKSSRARSAQESTLPAAPVAATVCTRWRAQNPGISLPFVEMADLDRWPRFYTRAKAATVRGVHILNLGQTDAVLTGNDAAKQAERVP